MTRPFLRWLTLSLAVLVAACAAPPSGDQQASPVSTTTAVEDPAPAPDVPLPALSSLLGAGPAQLGNLLGKPGLKRTEPPAELWQYQSKGCVLALYLYQSSKGGALTLTHADAHDGKGAKVAAESCLHDLMREKG